MNKSFSLVAALGGLLAQAQNMPELISSHRSASSDGRDLLSHSVNKNNSKQDPKTDLIIAPSPSKFLVSAVDDKKYYMSPSKSGLEGLNPDLVSRIQAKEAAKAKLEMTRSQDQIERIALLKKLPKLARIVK